MAAPSFNNFLQNQASTAAVNQLIGSVHFTRHAAITLHNTVTLCPASNSNRFVCGRRNHWQYGALAFLDTNNSGSVDNNETVIKRFPALQVGSATYWRSFRNRSFLQINARGLTNWQNGNILYCPPGDDPQYARQIIINVAARVRLARDTNRDGVVEDARGRPISCPER
ncbi:MAG: GspH/FimT family pseudopilin [Pseudomonadales bacterium]|nr:GspH/FimT family pseudopilin [Pseudomonadales bacterium]